MQRCLHFLGDAQLSTADSPARRRWVPSQRIRKDDCASFKATMRCRSNAGKEAEVGMNLDKASAGETDAPLAPRDWTMELTRVGSQFIAEVEQANVIRCRLSAFAAASDEPKVRRELADKARWWIHEFLGRNE